MLQYEIICHAHCPAHPSISLPSTSQHISQTGTKIGLCPSVEGAIRTSTERLSDVSTVWFSDVSPVQFIVRFLTPSHDSIPLSGSVFHYSLDVVSSAVLGEHVCSCLVQCKAFGACAAQGRLGCSIIHTRRPSLPPPKKSICVRFSLSESGCMDIWGGASSSAAAIIWPSKSSKPVPVNPGIRRTTTWLLHSAS